MHAVGHVEPQPFLRGGPVESMVGIRVDGDGRGLAPGSELRHEIDAGLRRRPVVAAADEQRQRCGERIPDPAPQRVHASGIKGHRGAKIRCRRNALAPERDLVLLRVDRRQHGAAAVRPPEHGDAVGANVAARLQPPQRALDVPAPMSLSDRTPAVLQRADLLGAARAKAVGIEHDVAFGDQQFGHRLVTEGQPVTPGRERAVHAAAAVEGDDRGTALDSLGIGRARLEEQRVDDDVLAGHRVAVERFDRDALGHGRGADGARTRREKGPRHQPALPPLHSSSRYQHSSVLSRKFVR